jgi:hypothetical protein
MMNHTFRTSAFALILFSVAVATAADDDKPAEAGGKADKAALEKEFGEKLTGSTLVGTYSIVGAKNDKPPQPERYELDSVKKLEGREDYWTFTARIKYGDNDVKVPITLKVLWAGDTPMISMTDAAIPGLGTFTARVMFYGDRYAGTWQHGKVGGHMWGLIEKPEKAKQEAPQER